MLDLAFFVAVLLSLLKIGEIALRPHQKKWLQSHAETLTLALDYRTERFDTWLSFLRRINDLHLIIASLLTLPLAALLIDSGNNKLVFVGLFLIVAALYTAAAAGVWRRAPEFLDWAGIDKLTFQSVVRIFGLFAIVSAITALRFLGRQNEGSGFEFASAVLGLGFLIYFIRNPRRYFAWNAFSGLITLITLLLIFWFIAAGFARVLVGIMWRVVEYPSGAWAALLFLATAVLGLVKLYV